MKEVVLLFRSLSLYIGPLPWCGWDHPVQILSGTFCVIGETVSHHSLYDDADVEAGEWIAAHTPIDARFLTTSEGTHVRPVRVLVVFCGPTMWHFVEIWSL